MRFRQLEYFVAVAEELHFGRAAQRLHMSQPPLSQQIRLLEEELDVRLFERTSQRVSLTAEGRYLQEEAKAILGRLDAVRNVLQTMARGEIGTMRVGYVESVPLEALMRVVGRFHERFPEMELATQDQGTTGQLQDLQEGRKELGLITKTAQVLPDGLAWRTILLEHYVLAMPEAHPLVHKPDLKLADLNGQCFLRCTRSGNLPYWENLVHALHAVGLTDMEYKSCCELPIKHALVAQGAGVSLLPSFCMRRPLPGVIYTSLASELPPLEVAAVWHVERETSVLKTFVAFLEEELRTLGYSPQHPPTQKNA